MSTMAPMPEPEQIRPRQESQEIYQQLPVEEQWAFEKEVPSGLDEKTLIWNYINDQLGIQDQGLAIAPRIEEDVLQFAEQSSLLQTAGFGVHPCVMDGQGVPFPLKLGPSLTSLLRYTAGNDASSLPQMLATAFAVNSVGAEFKHVPIEDARAGFVGKILRFISGFLDQSPPPNGPGYPYAFTVETVSHGLRVHYSEAYFFNPYQIFSAPTTPVSGYLHPGIYIFGASRAGQAPVFDTTAEYEVPVVQFASLGL